jgi:hypothetical protein
MSNKLLIEASLLSYDAYADTADYQGSTDVPLLPAGNAVSRGWTPLTLGGLVPGGVDEKDIADLVGNPDILPPGVITSAVHLYTGSLEGRQTLAIAYRGTDEGPNEFAFQGSQLPSNPFGFQFGWDLYYAAHVNEVGAALVFAADPTSGIEQVLITGHSLGGIVGELTAARLLSPDKPLEPLAEQTLVVTFGSPGSTESADNLNQHNIVHSDDFVAQLSALSPLFQAIGVAREGVDLQVERPEATLPDFQPENLDTVEELFAAVQDPRLFVEHRLALYLDTAELLDSAEAFVPTVSDAGTGLFRWLDASIDRTIVGTDGRDSLPGGGGNDLIFAQGGQDLVFGQNGDDVLIASGGNNFMQGGLGDDVLVGASGNDFLQGGAGDDRLYPGGGNNIVDGGPGIDTAVFNGAREGFLVSAFGSFATVSQSGPTPSRTIASNVEFLEFDNVTLALEGGKLTPVAPSLVASVSVDDLVITSEVV